MPRRIDDGGDGAGRQTLLLPAPSPRRMVWAALALAAAAVAVALALPYADAAIPTEADLRAAREHLGDLKQKERDLRAQLDDVITEIPAVRQDIKNAAKACEREREQVRKAQATAARGASWDDVAEVDRQQREARAACEHVDNERDRLGDLIRKQGELKRDHALAAWRADEFGNRLKINSTRAAQTTSVGIYLGSTCKAAGPPTCPTYEDLIPWDTSLMPHTGPFRELPDGTWERGPAPILYPHRLYQNDSTHRVVVDPPARLARDLRLIVLTPDVPPTPVISPRLHIAPSSDPNSTAWAWDPVWRHIHAVPYLHTRLTADYCTVALVSARGDWAARLNDTIAYLRSACDGPTSVRTVGWDIVDVRPYPTGSSPSWAEQRLAERIERECVSAYKACPELPPRQHVAPTPPPPSAHAQLNSAPALASRDALQVPRRVHLLRPPLLVGQGPGRIAVPRLRQALPRARAGSYSGTGGAST